MAFEKFFKKQFLALWIVLAFCAQLSAQMHAAEHDFEVHEHHGEVCTLSLLSAQPNAISASDAPEFTLPVYSAESDFWVVNTAAFSPSSYNYCTRAPPFNR